MTPKTVAIGFAAAAIGAWFTPAGLIGPENVDGGSQLVAASVLALGAALMWFKD